MTRRLPLREVARGGGWVRRRPAPAAQNGAAGSCASGALHDRGGWDPTLGARRRTPPGQRRIGNLPTPGNAGLAVARGDAVTNRVHIADRGMVRSS